MRDRAQLQRFLAFAFAGADLLLEVGRDGTIGLALGAASGVAGRSDESLKGSRLEAIFAPAEAPLLDALLQGIQPGARLGPLLLPLAPSVAAPAPDRAPQFEERLGALSLCCLPDAPDLVRCSLSLRGAAGRRPARGEREAESLLLEPGGFIEAAGDAVERAAAEGAALGMTLFEVEGLEALRERLPEADHRRLLRQLASLMREISVDGDTVGRLGPARFAVVHGTDTDLSGLEARFGQVARRADPDGPPLVLHDAALPLQADGLSRREVVRAIGYAVEQVTRDGLGAGLPSCLESALQTLVRDTVARMQDFRGRVDDRRFGLAYQPVVRLADRRISHFELLARFEEGQSPAAVLGFAESLGMIEGFDLAVCRRALELLTDKGFDRRVRLAVNLSGRSLQNDAFVEALLQLLRRGPEIGNRLHLEVTESVELGDLERAQRVIQDLRGLGHKVYLDDFGAGASGFSYLHALTVDGVKIDGGYIQRMGRGPRDYALLKGLIRLCVDLRVEVVAEKVETRAQARQLQELSVGYGQGWLFGRPGPAPLLGDGVVRLTEAT